MLECYTVRFVAKNIDQKELRANEITPWLINDHNAPLIG